jgi:RecA-family ATPase
MTDYEFIPPDYEPPGEPIEAAAAVEFRMAAAFCAEYVPISHVVEPFIRSSSLYTLTARTGAGKTALLIIMALAVATGRGKELLGREVERGRVAVIVAENPDGFRMRLMVTAFLYNIALSEIANDLLILDKRMKPEAIAAALNRLSDDGPVSLIILDTLQGLFDGDDLNHNVQAGDFMRRWQPLTQIRGKPAVVIAAHPVKNAAADNSSPVVAVQSSMRSTGT